MKLCYGCTNYDTVHCEYCDECYENHYAEPVAGSVMWFMKSWAESYEIIHKKEPSITDFDDMRSFMLGAYDYNKEDTNER